MTAQERLVAYYRDSYEKLIKKLEQLPPGASWKRHYERLLKEIQKTVAKLDRAAANELVQMIRRAYTAAEAKALAGLPGGPFGGLNRMAMQLVAENAVDDLSNANHYFGRHMSDRIRQIGLDAIAEKLSTAQTVKEAQRRIIEMMRTEGMTAMVDAAGRRHRLESYAELVARTTTREATNTATTETGQQLGYDLVKFSVHYPTCEVCAPVQGRVFSISGNDKRFPALSEVPGFDQGFKTIHPNCRHVLIVTVEALWTDEEREKYLADAKKPIRGDTRSAEEVDRYNATQAEKRERWQDRRQWEKYKAALGDDAPQTFSGFRAVKRANADKWRLMQVDYKRRSRLAKNAGVALPNAENSVAAEDKFLKYFYNPANKDGFTKGLAFNSRLGYNVDNWEAFRADLLSRSRNNPAALGRKTEHGIKYEQKMVVYGLKGAPMDVMVIWIVKDKNPLLVTAYPD